MRHFARSTPTIYWTTREPRGRAIRRSPFRATTHVPLWMCGTSTVSAMWSYANLQFLLCVGTLHAHTDMCARLSTAGCVIHPRACTSRLSQREKDWRSRLPTNRLPSSWHVRRPPSANFREKMFEEKKRRKARITTSNLPPKHLLRPRLIFTCTCVRAYMRAYVRTFMLVPNVRRKEGSSRRRNGGPTFALSLSRPTSPSPSPWAFLRHRGRGGADASRGDKCVPVAAARATREYHQRRVSDAIRSSSNAREAHPGREHYERARVASPGPV